MASDVDICNQALSLIGADAVVASIDPPDGSVEAGHCARFYPMARDELFEAHSWSWAKGRAKLALVVNPSTVWAYAYALPSDCVTAIKVLQAYPTSTASTLLPIPFGTFDTLRATTESVGADFTIEGGALLCNEPEAVLMYARDTSDTGRFSAGFRTTLAYLLASYLCGPIVKGQAGANNSATLRQLVFGNTGRGGMAAMHVARDANQSSEQTSHVPAHMQART